MGYYYECNYVSHLKDYKFLLQARSIEDTMIGGNNLKYLSNTCLKNS